MRSQGNLPKTLARLNRCLNLFQTRVHSDSLRTLNSDNKDEMVDACKEIIRLHSAILKMSKELAMISRQMHALTMDQAKCVPISIKTRQKKKSDLKNKSLRYAFAAVPSGMGGIVVRVFQNVSGLWFQQSYGEFESWTEAQSFAAMLNGRLCIEPQEALNIIARSELVSRGPKRKRTDVGRI